MTTENLQNQTEQLDGQQQYEKIISLKEQGYTYEQIAEEMGIGSKGTVSKIIKRFEGVSDTKETETQTAETVETTTKKITKEPIGNLHVNTSRKNVKTIFSGSRIKQEDEDEEQKETFERPEVRNVTTTPTAKNIKTVCTIQDDGVRLSKSINK